METTTLPDYPRGITFEQVWAAIIKNEKESDRILKAMEESGRRVDEANRLAIENSRRVDENSRRMDEANRLVIENSRRVDETSRRMDEANRLVIENSRRMDETNNQMGNLHNRFGELAEHLVAPGIVKRFDALGYKGKTVISSNVKLRDEQGVCLTEIDLVLERDDCILAVEVKSKPSIEDVKEHIEQLKMLREYRDKFQKDERKIRGAVAGAVFVQNVKQFALKSGLYVLAQSGDTMQIDLPSGFVPAEW